MPYKNYEDRLKRRREYNKSYYADNKEKILERTNTYYKQNKDKHAECMNRKRKRNIKEIEFVKLSYGCQNLNCKWVGEFVGCDLDLHHTGDDKVDSISKLPQHSLPKIVKEINKCVVLCANCHRQLHAGIFSVEQTPRCHVLLEGKKILLFKGV
jgi:hypothetical protein